MIMITYSDPEFRLVSIFEAQTAGINYSGKNMFAELTIRGYMSVLSNCDHSR